MDDKPQAAAGPVQPPRPDDPAVTGAAYAALGMLGVVYAVIASFLHSASAFGLPLAALAFSVLNFAGALAAGRAMGGRAGAAVPSAGWFVVVVLMSSERPEGTLVVPGDAAGYTFIIGGAAALALAVLAVRPRDRAAPPPATVTRPRGG